MEKTQADRELNARAGKVLLAIGGLVAILLLCMFSEKPFAEQMQDHARNADITTAQINLADGFARGDARSIDLFNRLEGQRR